MDDVELTAAWVAIGLPNKISRPSSQEIADLADPRHRSRGESTQHKRLKANRQKLQRAQAAARTAVAAANPEPAAVTAESVATGGPAAATEPAAAVELAISAEHAAVVTTNAEQVPPPAAPPLLPLQPPVNAAVAHQIADQLAGYLEQQPPPPAAPVVPDPVVPPLPVAPSLLPSERVLADGTREILVTVNHTAAGDDIDWSAADDSICDSMAAMGVSVPNRLLTRAEAWDAAHRTTSGVPAGDGEAASWDDIPEWQKVWQWQVQSSAAAPALVPGRLRTGKRVVIRGLMERPDLNGQTGVITCFDVDAERVPVLLDAKRMRVNVRQANLVSWAMTLDELRTHPSPPKCVPCAGLAALNATLPLDFLAFNEDARGGRANPADPHILTYYVHRDGYRSLYRPTGVPRPAGVVVSFGDFDGPCGDPLCQVCVGKAAEVEARVQRMIARLQLGDTFM